MIGTPAGGGQVTVQYLLSIMDTISNAGRKNAEINRLVQLNHLTPESAYAQSINVGLYTLSNESLLARGRNHIAQVALTQDWEKLMFIDADAGWTFPQLDKILMSQYPVTAGICPLKTYPISMNYLPFLEDEEFFNDGQRSWESTCKMRDAHNARRVAAGKPADDKVPVAFVGTAFLCIDCSVLRKMAETAPQYQYPNPYTGHNETHWAFFDGGPVSNTYFSEDWAFCDKARELGYDINIDTSVVITHSGSHTYRAL